MKVLVEFEDFWLSEDGEIDIAIQQYITQKVAAQVWNKVSEKIKESIDSTVKKMVDEQLKTKIAVAVESIIGSPDFKVEGQYSSDGMLTIDEYVKSSFERNTGWRSPADAVATKAKNYGNEMKNRYDLMFASQLVAKMNENGLLKDGVYESLMAKESKGD